MSKWVYGFGDGKAECEGGSRAPREPRPQSRLRVSIPVPWSRQPIVIKVHGIIAIGVIVVFSDKIVAAAHNLWRLLEMSVGQ
jgi:hypothetical protein